MKIINEHIKTREFKNVYLLYGAEDYLRKQYRDKLREAVVGEDTMNYSYFEGNKLVVKDILDVCETMPFFADYRMVVVENSGFFKSSNDALAEYISKIPDYLILVFVEEEIDKRNRVFKTVSANGYVSEMKPQPDSVLFKWIVALAKAEEMTIDKPAIELLLSKTGASMELIKSELDKVFSYCVERKTITETDIEAVCSTQTVSKIFDMIGAVASKKQKLALELYYDLLTLREPPMRILYLMVNQFNGILQVKEGLNNGKSSASIASEMGVAPFIVGRYVSQAKNFSVQQLKEALDDCADVEERVKTGKLNPKLSVELILIKYSTKGENNG